MADHDSESRKFSKVQRPTSAVRSACLWTDLDSIPHMLQFSCPSWCSNPARVIAQTNSPLRVSVLHYFYQQSVTHFLLTDCDQQRHFRYSTRGLLVTEIPFSYLCSSILHRPSSILFSLNIRAYMHMVRWMCGVKLKDRLPSKKLRERLGVDDIALVLQQNRLRWYGHVL